MLNRTVMMPHGGFHWAKGGPIIRRRPGNLSPLKGAHLSPNRWSTACGRGYILSPLRGSLGCVKYVDAPLGEAFTGELFRAAHYPKFGSADFFRLSVNIQS